MQKYQDLVVDRSGNALANAQVLVQNYPVGTTATIYSDNGVTIAANPLTTDGNGHFQFYAANGRYQLAVSGPTIAGTLYTYDILLQQMDVLLQTISGNGSLTSFDFTGLTGYPSYRFVLSGVEAPSGGGDTLRVRVSEDNGATYKSSGYAFAANIIPADGTGTPIQLSSASNAFGIFTDGIKNGLSLGVNGEIITNDLANAAINKVFLSQLAYANNSSIYRSLTGMAVYTADQAAVNGVRFTFAGDVVAGSISCYGRNP